MLLCGQSVFYGHCMTIFCGQKVFFLTHSDGFVWTLLHLLWTKRRLSTFYDGRLWTNCIRGHIVMAGCGQTVFLWTFCEVEC